MKPHPALALSTRKRWVQAEDTEECGGKPSFLMRFFNKILCALMIQNMREESRRLVKRAQRGRTDEDEFFP
jgi:hypothetical protein